MIQQENNKIFSFCFAFLFSVCLALPLLALPLAGQAVGVFLNSENQEMKMGDEFKVDFFLNTENKDINALEGEIIFPNYLLELKEIRDGNSIINFWIERPKINEEGKVVFSGIIPGGYSGKKGLIFSAIFLAKNKGENIIKINNFKVLLNDGKGTEIDSTVSDFNFSIFQQATTTTPIIISKIKDLDSPEPFNSVIFKDSSIFNNKYFLIFATQDKGVGIRHYEVSECGSPFILAKSPYVLKNQKLDCDIKIKAIDKEGNSRIETITAQKIGEKLGIKMIKIILPIIILLLLIIILVILIK